MQPSSIDDGPVKKAPVALQLWTVREQARRDFAGTLQQAAALGYAGVEHVHSLGYGGLPAQQVRGPIRAGPAAGGRRSAPGVGPELLQVEVDVHWVARGGPGSAYRHDPVAYLRKVGERCPLVHFKDLNPAWAAIQDHADPRPFTEVGTGMIDFPAVAKAAEHAHWWIVEQDFCAGPAWESARRSLENLRAMGLA